MKTELTFNGLKKVLYAVNGKSLPGHNTSPDFTAFSYKNRKAYDTVTGNAEISGIKEAGVVLLIHEKKNIPHLTFIKRSVSDRDRNHSGQIAFPGGKKEKWESIRECAFRELEEEIGIRIPPHTPPIPLSPFYVRVSNFQIHPFVCLQQNIGNYIIDSTEVNTVIEAPLIDLENQYKIFKSDMEVRGYYLPQVPYYQLGEHKLWGATAMIFTELLYIIQNPSYESF